MKRAIQELKIARERNERRLLEFKALWPDELARGAGVTASIAELRASIDSIDKAIDVLERYERGGIVDPVLDFQRQHPGAFVPSVPGDNRGALLQCGPPPASSYPGMLHGQSLDERADAKAGAILEPLNARVDITGTALRHSMGLEGTVLLVDDDGSDE